MPLKPPKAALNFAAAIHSFVGFLEGTGKSLHTIKSYRSDLHSFQEFLQKQAGVNVMKFIDVRIEDLQRYREHLQASGFRTNTRRRKLLTVRRFYHYLSGRSGNTENLAARLVTPAKVERVPETVPMPKLLAQIKELPTDSEVFARNRVLLWALAETGAGVSEIARLRFSQFGSGKIGAVASFRLSIDGKNPREVPVSKELFDAVQSLQAFQGLRPRKSESENPYLFLGFNRFGPLGFAITDRGVELVVKHFSKVMKYSKLTPRTIRHSVAIDWFENGLTREAIQSRLGLRSSYSLRVYEPLFQKYEDSKGEH